jgi:hypothetical protein
VRRHARLGFLVALLAVMAVAVYVQRQVAAGGGTLRIVAVGQTMFVGTIRLDLDAALLARLDAESPKLVLEDSSGAVVPVLVWRVDRGQAVLQQFHNMQPAH